MREPIDIDVTFDFRSDTPKGKDPDAASPTLRRYHHRLWSRPLPLQTCELRRDPLPEQWLLESITDN